MESESLPRYLKGGEHADWSKSPLHILCASTLIFSILTFRGFGESPKWPKGKDAFDTFVH